MVEAARKYKVVVQVGTQRRSSAERHRGPRVRAVGQARQGARSPGPGSPATGRTSARRSRRPAPKGVDYDLWLGPAPAGRSPRTASITTGTGSGTTAPASSATTASTASTSPATCSASTPRRGSPAAAASTSTTTTSRRPTRRSPRSTSRPGPGGAAGCTLVWEHRVWEKKRAGGPVVRHQHPRRQGNAALQRRRLGGPRRRRRNRKPPGKNMVGARTRRTSSTPFAATPSRTPRSRRGTRARGCATSATSPTAPARRSSFDAKTETTDDPEANKLLGREYRKGFELPAV